MCSTTLAWASTFLLKQSEVVIYNLLQQVTDCGVKKPPPKKTQNLQKKNQIWTSQIYFRLMLFSWCVAQSRWKLWGFEQEDKLKVEVKTKEKKKRKWRNNPGLWTVVVFKDPSEVGGSGGLGVGSCQSQGGGEFKYRKRWGVSDWWRIANRLRLAGCSSCGTLSVCPPVSLRPAAPSSNNRHLNSAQDACVLVSHSFPQSLVLCWLCSCFPLRSGTPDDGRPRYELFLLPSTPLLSLLLSFVLFPGLKIPRYMLPFYFHWPSCFLFSYFNSFVFLFMTSFWGLIFHSHAAVCASPLTFIIATICHHSSFSHTASLDLSMLGCYTGGKQQFWGFFFFLPHPAHPSGLL